MKAIQFNFGVRRYVLSLLLGKLYEPFFWSPWSCTSYREIEEPRLPTPEWVKIQTRYGGICGSDQHLVHLIGSPTLSALGSFPFTPGHENVGTIVQVGDQVEGYSVGDRVVAEPTLWCRPRGFPDLCPACARGDTQLCERTLEGSIAPGLQIGACRDTGGSWGEFFVAHQSQLLRVPDDMSDESALMLEPFATCLHAVLANRPGDGETALVIGAGVIGLGVVAALRAVESKAKIIVLARHAVQKEWAARLGADHVILESKATDPISEFASLVGGRVLAPIVGRRFMMEGAKAVFECVGNGDTIDLAVRLAQAGGRVVLAGLASFPKGIDWTPIWLKELQVRGVLTYGNDILKSGRRRTFEVALELMHCGKVDLSALVTHRFPLHDYARAFKTLSQKGTNHAVKAVFEF